MASLGLLPVYLNVTARAVSLRGALALCAVIRGGTTAIDFVDILKCHGMCAKTGLRLFWGSRQRKLVVTGKNTDEGF